MRPLTSAALAATVLVLAACQEKSPSAPAANGPEFAISDGANGGGNPDFFFLPPLVSNPRQNPNWDDGQFNAGVAPVVQICEGTATSGTACSGNEVARFTMTTGPGSETVRRAGQQYVVNWHTNQFNLSTSQTYRVRVLVASHVLGFADVQPVANQRQLKNVNTGDYVGLVDGQTLPIKFRIENGALCDPPGTENCISKTVDLNDGGNVTVPETGDRLDVPPQPTGPEETITIQECGDIAVDLPKFGHCIRITADPPLTSDLSLPATVSICSLPTPDVPNHDQEQLITLYRQDTTATHDTIITALPHASAYCPDWVGQAPAPPKNFADAGWRLLRGAVGALLGERDLYAAPLPLHLGPGGLTGGFSDFQFVLPAKMTPLPGTDGQTAVPGHDVPNPPGVMVEDQLNAPVAGATVRFAVTQGDGTVVPLTVTSDATGKAQLTSWTLGTEGENQARATGRGIAGPDDAPYMPDPPETGDPVTVGTGTVTFTATAAGLADGFETESGWSATGFWNRSTLTGISNTAYPTYVHLASGDASDGSLPPPYEGSDAFWYGQASQGNYMGLQASGDGALSGGTSQAANSGTLTSPTFLVPPGSPMLRFNTWFEVESVDVNAFDLMAVSIRDVDANTTTSLGVLNPSTDVCPPSEDVATCAPTPYTSGGLDAAPVWYEVTKDLSAYAGKHVQLIFSFNTVDVLYNGFRGWIVDNVRVGVNVPPAPGPHLSASGVSHGLNPVPPPGTRKP